MVRTLRLYQMQRMAQAQATTPGIRDSVRGAVAVAAAGAPGAEEGELEGLSQLCFRACFAVKRRFGFSSRSPVRNSFAAELQSARSQDRSHMICRRRSVYR